MKSRTNNHKAKRKNGQILPCTVDTVWPIFRPQIGSIARDDRLILSPYRLHEPLPVDGQLARIRGELRAWMHELGIAGHSLHAPRNRVPDYKSADSRRTNSV